MADCNYKFGNGSQCSHSAEDVNGYCIGHSPDEHKSNERMEFVIADKLRSNNHNFEGWYFNIDPFYLFLTQDSKASKVIKDANFKKAYFRKSISLKDTRFVGTLNNFEEAIFSGDYIDFKNIEFESEISFKSTKFEGLKIDFSHTHFKKYANFNEAIFGCKEEVSFAHTIFDSGAEFSRAEFYSDNIDYQSAIFTGKHTRFYKTIFKGAFILFCEGKFSSENTLFQKSIFGGENAKFDGCIFNGDLTGFVDTQFNSIETTFMNTHFNSKRTYFIRTIFNSDKTQFDSSYFKGKERASINFQNVKIGEFKKDCFLTFDKTILDNVRFESSNLSKVLFENAIFEDVEFMKNEWAKKREIFLRNGVLGDEIFADKDKGSIEHYKNLEILYRRLKRISLEKNDNENAGYFYYGEMEMKRKQFFWYNLTRIKYAFFRWLCGYGEKPIRPLFWSFMLLFISAILTMFWGLQINNGLSGTEIIHYNPSINLPSFWILLKDWLSCIDYFYKSLFMREPDYVVPISYHSQIILRIISTIILPFLIGLFVMAFRRRLAR